MVQDRLEFFTLHRLDLLRSALRTVFQKQTSPRELGYRVVSKVSVLLILSSIPVLAFPFPNTRL